MAVSSGPKIINDGLVFYFDTENPRSWRGKPITNLIGPSYANVYHPSNKPASGAAHSNSYAITNEIEPPVPGIDVYKAADTTSDTQTIRFSMRLDMDAAWLNYDTTYTWSYYIYIPKEFQNRLTNTTSIGLFQNTAGSDWHYFRGYEPTYNYYSAGSILDSYTTFDVTKTGEWQRVSVTFTPLSANVQIAENGGNDNNKWAAGYHRVNFLYGTSNDAIRIPYHFYVAGGQVIEGSVDAPFAIDSRGTTESIVDLTNNNTLTPVNLTYDADTFYFPGNGSTASAIRSNKTRTTLFTDPNIYSYEVICKRNGVGSTTTIVIGNQGYNCGILMNTAGQFVASAWYSTAPWTVASPYPTTSVVANDTWAHVVMTFNKNGFERIYLNGVLQGSLDVSGFNTSAGGNWYGSGTILVVGGDNFAAYSFPGEVAIARMYDKELTADEIKANFESVRQRFGI